MSKKVFVCVWENPGSVSANLSSTTTIVEGDDGWRPFRGEGAPERRVQSPERPPVGSMGKCLGGRGCFGEYGSHRDEDEEGLGKSSDVF